MRQVILYIAVSLDGYIAPSDGDVSWLDPYNPEDYGFTEFYRRIGVVIMGAATYEQNLTFGEWPYGATKTYVITGRELEVAPGGNIRFYSGDLARLVSQLTAADDRDIWLLGGGKLITSFLNAGLIDKFMLFMIPILLAEGIPLFSGIAGETAVRAETCERYPDGVVRLDYSIKRPGK